jgi:hypothetical protein
MTEIAFCCRPSEVLAGRKVIGMAQGEGDRGWQDKSRKVRPVGRSGSASKFNHTRNIAKTRQNLPFLLARCSSSDFVTLRRIR